MGERSATRQVSQSKKQKSMQQKARTLNNVSKVCSVGMQCVYTLMGVERNKRNGEMPRIGK